jgi:ElaB/YqjD/DUF883 family membrane-anchored ribosome-binding protein
MSQLDNFMKNNDLFDAVKNGKEKLENIKNTIGEKVNETLKEARVKITEAGDQIRLATKNVTDAVGDLQHQIDVNTGPAVTTADEYITLYGAYPYYGGARHQLRSAVDNHLHRAGLDMRDLRQAAGRLRGRLLQQGHRQRLLGLVSAGAWVKSGLIIGSSLAAE